MNVISTIIPIKINILPENLVYLLNSTGKYGYICFFDSSLVPNKYSKFSYVCWKPRFIIKSDEKTSTFLNCLSGKHQTFNTNPLLFLKEISNAAIAQNNIIYHFASENYSANTGKNNLPDFIGGLAGYISYDLKNYIERLPQKARDDIFLPLYIMAYYDNLMAYDIDNKRWFFIKNFVVDNKEMGKTSKSVPDYFRDCFQDEMNLIYKDISDREIAKIINKEKIRLIKEIEKIACTYGKVISSEKIESRIVKNCIKKEIKKVVLDSNFTKTDYLEAVKKAKEHIHNGDIYQVNITQRFRCVLDVDPYSLYYILRQKNAAPFSAFLSFPEVKIGSSSPERFLFLKNSFIQTRPIKGTRPRGNNESEDVKYMTELQNSIKDHAELNMIVDLERNDLGKFCEYGSVNVKGHAIIEKYARVFHLVSTVTGKVKKGYDFADIIKSMFPGGSITGAPKIRAMQIIDELEPTTRSIYTGAIGYAGINETMDFNIAIRTFIIKGRELYYNVGGGIVEDSNPEDEYQETLDKGKALQEALKFFELKNLLNIR
ncbi:MAG: aminodeoxychorismate synthase component I [Actinobacteria bacterium]|nr:aminodeoxychorismate synthase component I [Actinomycetota bacterium]